MPKVGKKLFPYTAKGKKAANEYAKKSGKTMTDIHGISKSSKPDKNHPWRRGM